MVYLHLSANVVIVLRVNAMLAEANSKLCNRSVYHVHRSSMCVCVCVCVCDATRGLFPLAGSFPGFHIRLMSYTCARFGSGLYQDSFFSSRGRSLPCCRRLRFDCVNPSSVSL